MLSSFHTKSSSLSTIVNCLRICRAGLSTNFHCFSMMILFSLIQFTTVVILECNFQTLTNYQMLYEDLFITFPIFITINMTLPSSKLSVDRPASSFFSLKNVVSMAGQLIIQSIAQIGFVLYLQSL
jgi:magnesium-transporting ATPase (P-type)